jgi:hypothetical protein
MIMEIRLDLMGVKSVKSAIQSNLKETGISLNVTYAEEVEKAYQQRKKNSQTYPQPQDDL